MSTTQLNSTVTIESIAKLFQELETSKGFFAQFAWSCCADDGWKGVRRLRQPRGLSRRQQGTTSAAAASTFIFCTIGDLERVASKQKILVTPSGEELIGFSGMLLEPLPLYWRGNREQIINAIEEQGFKVVCHKNNVMMLAGGGQQ